jgi:hypothetical protein
MDAVLRLEPTERVSHFVKRVVDEQVAWGLWKDGWALMAEGDGQAVFPLWPGREYAEGCAVGEWSEYVPAEIPLDDILGELSERLEARNVRPAVFPTPGGRGVVMTLGQLKVALEAELRWYE